MATLLLSPTPARPSPSSTRWSECPSPCWCWPCVCRSSCTLWSWHRWAFCTEQAWSSGPRPSCTSSCCCSGSSWASLWLLLLYSAPWRCPGHFWMGSTLASSPCAPSVWEILYPGCSLDRNTGQCIRSVSWVSAFYGCILSLTHRC